MTIDRPDVLTESSERQAGPITDRRSIDYMFSGTRHQLTELSGQADLKASIVITTSALVLTLCLSRDVSDDFRASLVALSIGVLGAFVFAVTAVVPKFGSSRGKHGQEPMNPLFFGHVAHIELPEYRSMMLDLIKTDEPIYQALLADIHAQSRYLVTAKYRWLRLSYASLFLGFVAAAAARLIVAVA